jgi:hypothetical protein
MHALHRINPWQHDAAWTCLGLHLLEVLRDFDHPRLGPELRRYREMVERLGCFPEVLDPHSAELFEGPLLASEDSMLWAANLWSLLDRTGRTSNATGPRRTCAEACGRSAPEAEP